MVTAAATSFAAVHWAARKAAIGDLGRKVEHLDRRLADRGTHDRELAEALWCYRASERVAGLNP